jgi:hypothetical protein
VIAYIESHDVEVTVVDGQLWSRPTVRSEFDQSTPEFAPVEFTCPCFLREANAALGTSFTMTGFELGDCEACKARQPCPGTLEQGRIDPDWQRAEALARLAELPDRDLVIERSAEPIDILCVSGSGMRWVGPRDAWREARVRYLKRLMAGGRAA